MNPSAHHGSFGHRNLVVGREPEQALLRQSLDEMLRDHGSLVLVSGEAGIGKTTLVRWLASEAVALGCRVLRGGCFDLTITSPYGPWIELLRVYRAESGVLDILTDSGDLAHFDSQDDLFKRIARFFGAVADERPLVVILEDLHWADQSSIDLLRYVARHLSEHRCLVLATHRQDELQRQHPLSIIMPHLVRESGAERLELRPFAEEGTRAFIQSRYTLRPSDLTRLERYLNERAEGNPLFSSELLRALEEERVLHSGGTGWTLEDLADIKVPTLLQQLIQGRLVRLGTDATLHLTQAAVIGQEIPIELWASFAGVPVERLLVVMERAIAARLLDATEHGAQFTHALVREAIYESVVPVRRRFWHRQVAEILLASPDQDPDVVAYHLRQGDDRRAIEWLQRAAERAERAYAWVMAAERLEDAAAMMADDPSNRLTRAALLTRAAQLQRYTEPRRSVSMLEEAHRAAAEAGDHALMAFTQAEMGLVLCFVNDLRAGLAALEAGVDALEALSSADQTRLLSLGIDVPADNERGTLAMWLGLTGHYSEALAQGLRVTNAFPYSPSNHELLSTIPPDAFNAVGPAFANLGQPDEALRYHTYGLEILKAQHHYAQVCWQAAAMLNAIVLPYRADDLILREGLERESVEAGRKARGAIQNWPPDHALLRLMAVDGRWAKMREIAPRPDGDSTAAVLWISVIALGTVARNQGDTELAWTIVYQFVPRGPAAVPSDDLYSDSRNAMCLAVSLSLDANDIDAAREWLEAHDRWLEWSGAVLGRAEGALLWAQYHHAADDTRQARRYAEESLTLAGDPRQPLLLVASHRFLGQLDRESKRQVEAEDQLSESLRLAQSCAAPFERALTLLELAKLYVAQGRHEDAMKQVSEVRAISEPLGALPILAAADNVARTLSSSTRSTSPLPAGLSRREGEVLGLVAQGCSNREIASALFISERTVEHHVSNLLGKLGFTSRAQAAVFAVEYGLHSTTFQS